MTFRGIIKFRGAIKAVAVSTAVVAITALGGLPASAATDTGWVPADPVDPDTVKACGTTLTIKTKIDEVEKRTRTDDRGNVRTDYRGRYVVKVLAADGRRVTLDNSGPYSEFAYANGDTYLPIQAPGLIYPFDPVEREAFAKAGLPKVFYFTKGQLRLFITADGREKVLTKPKNPVSVCTLLR